jgi:hypothetical protein
MENEYMKRGYLLPGGCKDLIDAFKPKVQDRPPPKPSPQTPPPILGEMTIPEWMTVNELAAALKQKSVRIVADLLKVGVFATTVKHQLDFDTISKVVRKYGFTAKRAA